MVERVRERSPNLRGLKVSDTPFSAVEPYLAFEGLDVFIGKEPLVLQGIERGAVGAVSGLATAFPEITAALVHDRSERANEQVALLRSGLQGIPFHAALKEVLVARDVLTSADVRAPLRGLTDDERATVLTLARDVSGRVASIQADRSPTPALDTPGARALGFAPAIPTREIGNRDPHPHRRPRGSHDAVPPVLSRGAARCPGSRHPRDAAVDDPSSSHPGRREAAFPFPGATREVR